MGRAVVGRDEGIRSDSLIENIIDINKKVDPG